MAGVSSTDGNRYTASALASMGVPVTNDDPGASCSWASCLSREDSSGAPVLIIDQLEEILTSPGPPSQKRGFFVDLLQAIRCYNDLRIVLSLREEFLVAIEREAIDLEPYWLLFPLVKLRAAAARQAIESPARSLGIDYHPDVVDSLLNELAQVRYVDYEARVGQEQGEFIEPLHLQIVSQTLWRKLPKGITRITWDDVQQAIPDSAPDLGSPKSRAKAVAGFVHSALAGFCSNVMTEVAVLNDFPVQMIELGCQQFISKSGTRWLVYREAEHTGALPNAIIDALAEKHLLRVEGKNGVPCFELAHDTLIEPVRERTQRANVFALQQLWLDLIRKMVADSFTRDGLDLMQVVHRLCYRLVNNAGDPIRSSASILEMEVGERALDLLRRAGLIRRVTDRPDDVEMSHPHLAQALNQIRGSKGRDPGPLYDAARIVFSCVSSTIVTVLFVMTSRSILQGLHLTLTQASGDGVVNGWFQGVIGSIDWSVFISTGLASWWFYFEHLKTESSANTAPQSKRSMLRSGIKQLLTGALVGGLGGLFGGILVTANLLYAQSANSLFEAGWILNRQRPRLTAFWETGFAWAMIFFGVGLGVSSGAGMVNALRSKGWKKLMARRNERTLAETIRALGPVLIHVLTSTWYVVVPVMFAAAFASQQLLSALSNPPGIARVLGESIVISFGAEGIISGLIFGIFALRTGFAIPPPGEPS